MAGRIAPTNSGASKLIERLGATHTFQTGCELRGISAVVEVYGLDPGSPTAQTVSLLFLPPRTCRTAGVDASYLWLTTYDASWGRI